MCFSTRWLVKWYLSASIDDNASMPFVQWPRPTISYFILMSHPKMPSVTSTRCCTGIRYSTSTWRSCTADQIFQVPIPCRSRLITWTKACQQNSTFARSLKYLILKVLIGSILIAKCQNIVLYAPAYKAHPSTSNLNLTCINSYHNLTVRPVTSGHRSQDRLDSSICIYICIYATQARSAVSPNVRSE